MTPHRPDDEFVSAVKKQVERNRKNRVPNLWGAAGIVGTVGWMVVTPTLIGIALGRFLDTRVNGGLFWTLSLLMLGLTVGCASAWRHIDEVING